MRRDTTSYADKLILGFMEIWRHGDVAAACPLAVVGHLDISTECPEQDRRCKVEAMAEPGRANAADPGLQRNRQGAQAPLLWDGGSLAFPHLGEVTGSQTEGAA